MSRILEQPVHIEEAADGLPGVIYWLTGRESVETVLDEWAETGEWWQGERPKCFYRVATDRSRVYELYREEAPLGPAAHKNKRYAEREPDKDRPTDERHVTEFHLRKNREEEHDSVKSRPPPTRKWIVYKLLD